MKRVVCFFLCAVSVSLLSGTAPAQSSQVPEEMPFDVPYGAAITLEQARIVADAAEAESSRRKWKHAIMIVDVGGNPVFFVKMDGTQLASAEIAKGKATTAVGLRRPTKIIQDSVTKGGTPTITLPNIVAVEGGLPLTLNGKIIGAIGVSGGAGVQDSVVAQAGLAALK